MSLQDSCSNLVAIDRLFASAYHAGMTARRRSECWRWQSGFRGHICFIHLTDPLCLGGPDERLFSTTSPSEWRMATCGIPDDSQRI